MLSLVYWTNHGLGLIVFNSTALADAWLGSLARDLPGWLCPWPWLVGGAGHASPKPGHLASESTSLTRTNHFALSTAPNKVLLFQPRGWFPFIKSVSRPSHFSKIRIKERISESFCERSHVFRVTALLEKQNLFYNKIITTAEMLHL